MSGEATTTPNFGSRVRSAREALGLMRRQLAAEAGIAEGTLKSIETCARASGRVSAYKIVSALAKRDPSKAVWVSEAPDTPDEAKRAARADSGRLHLIAELRATRLGKMVCLRIGMDGEALAKIVEHVRQWLAVADNPDGQLVAITMAIDDPDPLG